MWLQTKGRLFWKLFLALWLSMMLSVVGAAIYFHLTGPQHMHPPRGAQGMGPALAPRGMPPGPGADLRPPGPPRELIPYLPLVPLASGAMASLLCSLLLAWYLARPIRHLKWALSQVAQEHFDTRVQPRMGGRRDEIVDLAQDFDRMAAQLQKLSHSRKELLHDISHELRSPLSRMQAAVGLARQDASQAPQMLARIERETQRLDALIEELLTLHRLEGDAVWALGPVDLTELLQAVADDAAFEARMAGKTLVLDVDTPCAAHVNGELVCRALDNVIRNAIKFSPPGGTVRVRARVHPDDGSWRCEVQDRGPGVPPELLEAIFQPFMRVEGCEAVRGTGLGLAIARRAMVLHGGSVHAVAREGGGLAMRLMLPCVKSAQVIDTVPHLHAA
jgi:two-component system OmpR family sensor kinase